MCGLKKDVAGLEHNTHSTLPKSFLQLIARIKDRLANQRVGCGIAVLRTVINIVGETTPTGWTFFH
jgi:hypothetical protein